MPRGYTQRLEPPFLRVAATSEEGKQAAAKRTLTELEERRMTIDESQLYVPERSTKRSTGVALKQKSRSDGFAKQTVSMSARGNCFPIR